ncbi:Predicted pyridoxal phosphate-dependent enzyme apparently involved in regulation of cell wall biogenesis [Streptomyces sp. LamerLS-316]|uniref:DegT/DnrJ/EryC1/StrS family aminotransferase n=1 Tax=Streptomyces sp. NBC_00148 TaxID=2903626 RepID=A0AAU1LS05_9ACTN|nr:MULTISPECIES: DegT/DnrJ/EryC1/StrS family aminotransferase [unclassified Streptomyces]MYQ40630.1 degT/DnrJ/EryC1/StrS aminotransferase [Streptomyces sp. SID4921]SCK16665.1 Predicted pyridoxal phosphate-dependent enzyme apparently involved in regulation of cell wall biogenesis [Streptomyces sp. LamerLS-316]
MELFDTATVLTRVMTSGVVMSIEKSDRELPGLERLLTKRTGRAHAVLVNSRSAAVHAALAGQGIGHGDTVSVPELSPKDAAFLAWLGVEVADEPGPAAFEHIALDAGRAHLLDEQARALRAPALVVDLTGLGFGPAAAVLTDDRTVWARAERLKIFGAYDLRTMWTQEESETDLIPGVQFNYRLSPLVAACARMALSQAVRPLTTGAPS